MEYIIPFKQVTLNDVNRVGGKNASLGEMIQHLQENNIRVPSGFIVTVDAYWAHLRKNALEEKIMSLLVNLKKGDVAQLQAVGKEIRQMIIDAPIDNEIQSAIRNAYQAMQDQYGTNCSVAVRSSATAEDLPTASFAGQQETFLHVTGAENVINACRKSWASLFTNRAISYRIDQGFDHHDVALSVGVQKMVNSDDAYSGVMFTLDTESGHPDMIVINASYGLGEGIVKGEVNPDEFYVHKLTLDKGFSPVLKKRKGSKEMRAVVNDAGEIVYKEVSYDKRDSYVLSDEEILELARQALCIEKYYSRRAGSWSPMDIEWAKDANDGHLYIVQARPETVHVHKTDQSRTVYRIDSDSAKKAEVLATGKSIGSTIITARARVITSVADMHQLQKGEILVADMTDPDWEPVLKYAAGVITDRGGRTCHAAIVSREFGIPAVIGCGNATESIATGDVITLDSATSEQGYVYRGEVPYTVDTIEIDKNVQLPVKILVNMGNPDKALSASLLPQDGVGLARLEFIIATSLGVHPMALIFPEKITDQSVINEIEALTRGYYDKKEYFIDTLAQEVGTIAAAFYPKPVIVRLSDFKTNEYRQLLGGAFFEPEEENPMLGFRGAVRYVHSDYTKAFALECAALSKVRNEMGLANVKIMVPFVRTVEQAQQVIEVMKEYGLQQGENGLEIYMMVEVPSNVILLDHFAQYFDGFSIGSNDLTQMTLGVDRDSTLLVDLFDERDESVKAMMAMAIQKARSMGKPIGICGQAPSDFPELAHFLVERGITSLSLNVDSVISVRAELEK